MSTLATVHSSPIVFEAHDVKLPLEICQTCAASLVDANGRDVLTIDVHGERADADASALARLVRDIINNSGPFTFVTTQTRKS